MVRNEVGKTWLNTTWWLNDMLAAVSGIWVTRRNKGKDTTTLQYTTRSSSVTSTRQLVCQNLLFRLERVFHMNFPIILTAREHAVTVPTSCDSPLGGGSCIVGRRRIHGIKKWLHRFSPLLNCLPWVWSYRRDCCNPISLSSSLICLSYLDWRFIMSVWVNWAAPTVILLLFASSLHHHTNMSTSMGLFTPLSCPSPPSLPSLFSDNLSVLRCKLYFTSPQRRSDSSTLKVISTGRGDDGATLFFEVCDYKFTTLHWTGSRSRCNHFTEFIMLRIRGGSFWGGVEGGGIKEPLRHVLWTRLSGF